MYYWWCALRLKPVYVIHSTIWPNDVYSRLHVSACSACFNDLFDIYINKISQQVVSHGFWIKQRGAQTPSIPLLAAGERPNTFPLAIKHSKTSSILSRWLSHEKHILTHNFPLQCLTVPEGNCEAVHPKTLKHVKPKRPPTWYPRNMGGFSS